MTQVEVPLPFGQRGLNLFEAPEVLGPEFLVSASDVRYDDRGLRTRGRVSLEHTLAQEFYAQHPVGNDLMLGGDQKLQIISPNGGVVDHSVTMVAGFSSVTWTFVRFGGADESTYCVHPGTAVRKYHSASGFTTPTFTLDNVSITPPTIYGAAVWGEQNRMVWGPFARQTWQNIELDEHTLLISDVGSPTKFTNPDAIVRLRPGDGERIQAMRVWRDQLFVFKDSAYFVFTGSYINAAGAPVYTRRAVEAGIGCVSTAAVAVTPNGLCWAGKHGIYRSVGGEPEELSLPIRPFFAREVPQVGNDSEQHTGLLESAIASPSRRHAMRLMVHKDNLYVSVHRGPQSERCLLMFDLQRASWWLFEINWKCLSLWGDHMYGSPDGFALERYDPVAEIEAAVEAAHARCGSTNLQTPSVKRVHSLELWRSGPVVVQVYRDYEDDALSTVSLPVNTAQHDDTGSPRARSELVLLGARGTRFGFRIAQRPLDTAGFAVRELNLRMLDGDGETKAVRDR